VVYLDIIREREIMTKLTKMDRMVMAEVNKACDDMVNYNADGSVNWDYVDADAFMAITTSLFPNIDDPITKEAVSLYNATFDRYVDLIKTVERAFG